MNNILKSALNFVGLRNRDEHGEALNVILGSDFSFGKEGKATGIKEGFKLNSYVYSIIHRIATTAADIPISVYEYKEDGSKEIVTEGVFYDLVFNPNEISTFKSMLYESMVFQLANGNSFEYGLGNAAFNVPTQRFNLYPQYIKIKATEVFYGYEPTKYDYNFGNKAYPYSPEEIMHIKRFNPELNGDNPCYGLSPLSAAYRTLKASNEIQLSEASVIKNRGMMGMLTSKANRALTTDEKNMAQEALRKRIGGGSKFGQIGVTSGNMDYISFAMSPADLQLLESGVLKLRDICSVFGVSSRSFNDPNGTTFNNVKEDEKKYYTQAVIPPLKIYLDGFNMFYSKMYEKAGLGKFKLECNTDSIPALQEDDMLNAQKAKTILDGYSVVIAGLNEGKFGVQTAIKMLTCSFDITEEEAESIIQDVTIRDNQSEEK